MTVDAAAPSVTVLGRPPATGGRTLWGLMRPHLNTMLWGLLWLVLTNLCSLLVPTLVNMGVTLVGGGTAKLSLPAVIGGLIVLALVGAVVRTQSRIVLFNGGRDVERALRRDLFSHFGTLSLTFFGKQSTGDLMSRMTNDLTNIRLLFGFALLNTLNAVLVVVVSLPLMLLLNAKVALLALIPFPLVIVASQVVSKRMFRRTKENQEAIGKLSTVVQESLAGQMVVRAFSQEDAVVARFAQQNDAVWTSSLRLAQIRLLMGPLMGLMGSFAIAIGLYAGGQAVAAGQMTIGDVVELNTRILQLTWPMIAIGFTLSVWQRGKASLTRINEVLAAQPDLVDGARTRDAAALRGDIRAEGVVVEVGEGERRRKAVNGITMHIESGQFIGIVGKNGSGKSLLLKAIARQLPVARGQLFIDNHDVNDWHIGALRRGPGGIAVVPEDGFLFSRTIKENLLFGASDVSDFDVEAVVDLVDLRRDIERFPQGLQTVVGERGVTLSGGQRQRVALGRALLARPAILLLDDSLSAVDVETEQNIIRALQASRDRAPPTLLMVSHRLSALKAAHRILGLKDGVVTEQGTHEELLKTGGLYATLWGQEMKRHELEARVRGQA